MTGSQGSPRSERGPLRVVGRYALYNEIAAGGMATVHIGRLLGPVGFARTVAIKRLHPQFAKDPEFVSMFLDEARLAARVQHPNVVATIDVVATDGELFLIMDYVRGESLSKLLRTVRKQGGRVPPRIAASIVCGFLHGLHAAHEAKDERGTRIDLVHRDVSPQNVLVGGDGIPRVLDFGIAKAAGRIQVTRDGQIKGKLAYMPPEQLSGRDITRAVDIYASAVVMWETLTSERLYKGETESETLAKILRDAVRPPSTVASTIPKAFDAPLLRALSRDATKRHATARELAFELEKCVGVATASEVGEWVERMVGPILSAREDQIAQIESESAGVRSSSSARPDPESFDSDSDVSGVPSGRAGTLRGVGAPSNPALVQAASSSSRRPIAPTSTQRMPPISLRELPVSDGSPAGGPPSGGPLAGGPPSGGPPSVAVDESTGSRLTGSRFTGTMSLPVHKRLPILASAAGLLVLFVIVAIVIAGRWTEAPSAAATTASGSAAVSAGGSAALMATSPTSTNGIPDPAPPSSTAAPIDTEQPGIDVEPMAVVTAAPPIATATPVFRPTIPHATNGTHTAGRPPTFPSPAVPPIAKTAVTPPPPVRKNCDPPYTLDTNGRRKYKLECM